ncbi:MAG: hypothetical protein AAF721_37965 [Myxococcota bacterium]
MTPLVAVLVMAPVGATPSDAAPETPPSEPVRAPRFVEPKRAATRRQLPTRRAAVQYRFRPRLVRPALRVAPGFSGRVTGRPYAAFSLDVLASVLVGLHPGRRQLGLAPEAGYSLRAPGLDHDVVAGLGIVHGINVEGVTVGILPRFVAQWRPGAVGYGVRTGLWFDFAENGFSVELGHQWIDRPGADSHDLRITLGIDVLMLAFGLGDVSMEWL